MLCLALCFDCHSLLSVLCSLQKLSLFSCACAFTASPIIMYMSAATAMGAKASIAFTLCGFGAFTTGNLVFFNSQYQVKYEKLMC